MPKVVSAGPKFTVVVPLYNTERYIAETLDSLLAQTFDDFEVIVVNDASQDTGPAIVEQYAARDSRIQLVTQENRGLSGARNTGIRLACGQYIALLDADDAFLPDKLELHRAHLDANPDVGVSYAPSLFIDEDSKAMGIAQKPKLKNITADHIFCRNPVGNGSAPVLRRAMLDDIAFAINAPEGARVCWFDESFRQTEDLEAWCRIATTTQWRFEGIKEPLTLYRVSTSGLSANVEKQFEAWLHFRDKLQSIAPELVARFGRRAEGYMRRYLARRAAVSGDGAKALWLLAQAVHCHPGIIAQEPKRTLVTGGFAALAWALPPASFEALKGRLFGARRAEA
ncbi:MAG: glycosyltransferase family A protein [Pseudomonadota bacterium]